MSYDRMGRRVTKNDRRFVYDGYLQIADNAGNAYIWDCTEPIATRPLVWRHGGETRYYTHDGNKNVSEVVDAVNAIAAHYAYTPFGAVREQSGTLSDINPFRFSSEYYQYLFCFNRVNVFDTLGLAECCCRDNGRKLACDRQYHWKGC